MTNRARVLVVDDEEVVRLCYAASLAPQYEMQLAANGGEALRRMACAPADLVLLDLRMPGSDGLDVLKMLKSSWPESEVVVITGYPTLDTAKEAMRLGAFDYLAKPVGPDEVIGAAQNALLHKQWTLRTNNELTRSIP